MHSRKRVGFDGRLSPNRRPWLMAHDSDRAVAHWTTHASQLAKRKRVGFDASPPKRICRRERIEAFFICHAAALASAVASEQTKRRMFVILKEMARPKGFEPLTPRFVEIGNTVIPIQPSRSHSSQRMPVQITPNAQNEPLRTEMNTDDRDRAAKQ